MTFADRLAVMRAGRLEQAGAPEETYLAPRTAFVAGFLGRTNLLRGEADGTTVATDLGALALTQRASGPVLVSLRPEDLHLDRADGDAGAGSDADRDGIDVVVTERSFQGHDLLFRCRAEDGDAAFLVRTGPGQPLREGDRARLRARGAAVPLESSRR